MKLTKIITYPIRVIFRTLLTPFIIGGFIYLFVKNYKDIESLSFKVFFEMANEIEETAKCVLFIVFHLLTVGIFLKNNEDEYFKEKRTNLN